MSEFDCIHLNGITAEGSHGVYAFERLETHPFIADIDLFVDLSNASASDDIADTVHYGEIVAAVRSVLSGEPVNLIEYLAEQVAIAALSVAGDRALAARVTVHKPEAPLAGAVRDTSVTIWRGSEIEGRDDAIDLFARTLSDPAKLMKFAESTKSDLQVSKKQDKEQNQGTIQVILALGSNLGDRVHNLREAVNALERFSDIEVKAVSPLIHTRPVLHPQQDAQPDYLNAVVAIETKLTPLELLRFTQGAEAALGRVRLEKWGSRTLDIDIITYGNQKYVDPYLELPHPRAAMRAFVLAPWVMVDANAILEGKSVSELLVQCPDRDGIIRVWNNWMDPTTEVILDEGIHQTVSMSLPVRREGATGELRVLDDPNTDIAFPNPQVPQRRSILKLNRELTENPEAEQLLRRRRVTTRPTTTGFIPVVRLAGKDPEADG